MILADTSVHVDFLRKGDANFARALTAGQILTHPFVIGEIALGHLKNRAEILGLLQSLPKASVAEDAETLAFIETNKLHGRGIGYVDAHLLAAARLSDALLWTRDKRLLAVARDMSLAANLN